MKELSPLRKVHLLLMIVLLFCSGFSTVVFFGGFEFAVAGKDKLEVILTGCTTLTVMVMLLTGVLYLVRGYKKNAAGLRKRPWAEKGPDHSLCDHRS